MHWLLYPDKELWHLLNSRLYILQSKPGHCGEEKNLLSLPRFEPWIILVLWKLNGNEYSTVGDQVLNTPAYCALFFFELYKQPTPREAAVWGQCVHLH